VTRQTRTGTDNAVPQNLAAWIVFVSCSVSTRFRFFLSADRVKGEITHLARFAFACDSRDPRDAYPEIYDTQPIWQRKHGHIRAKTSW